MPDKVAEAYAEIHADTSPLHAGMGTMAQIIMTSVGALAGPLAGALTGAFAHAADPAMAAFGGALGNIGEWIKTAIGAEAAGTRMNAMLRASGEAAGWSAAQLKQMAEDLSKNSQYSQLAAQGAQSALLSFDRVRGMNFDQALKSSADLAAFMGTDLPQAANVLGRALQAPEHATRMLRQAHIYLTDQQEKLINSMAESGNILGAQATILDLVKTKYSGVAQAMAGTTEGQLAQVSKTWEEFTKILGDTFLPIVGAIAEGFSALIVGAQDLLGPVISDIQGGVRSMVSAVKGWFDDNKGDIQVWMGYLKEIVSGAWDFIKQIAMTGVHLISAAWRWLVGESLPPWEGIKNIITRVLDFVSTLFTDLPLTAKFAWTAIKLTIVEAADVMTDAIYGILAAFEAVWDAAIAGAKSFVEQMFKLFRGEVPGNMTVIAQDMAAAFNKGLADGMARYNFGESAMSKQLKGELNLIYAQMQALRQARRDAKEVHEEVSRIPNAKPITIAVQYQFVGAEEFYKQIQAVVSGGTVAQQQLSEQQRGNGILEQIRDKIGGNKPQDGQAKWPGGA